MTQPKTAKKKAEAPPAQTVHVDSRNRRSDDDGLEGHFVDIVAGEHAGRRGVFMGVANTEKDGWPKTIVVRTRDERDELLAVPYEDVRDCADYKGGR